MARIMLKSTNLSIHWHRRALLGLMTLGLVACGGGGGGGVVLDESGDETVGDEVSSYTVTPSVTAGSGGISPGTAQTANHGDTVEFTLTPNAGYIIDIIGGTCGGSLSGNTYITNAITANCTVQASFSLNSYTVTPSVTAGSGGISPGTAQTANHGDTVEFTLTPDDHYVIDTIDGTCGGSLSGNTYITNAITANCTVQASFSLNSYTVTPSVTAGSGSINPSTAQTANHGDTVEFTLTPNAGYIIDIIGGTCGGSLDTYTYTTNAITANCTVQASFTLSVPHDLAATAGDEEVVLSWAAVTGATDYCVYTSDTSGIHPDTAASYDSRTCTGNTDVSYTVTGLTNDIEYHFIVTTRDGSVESAASHEATATPEVPASRPLNDTGITLCGNYAFPDGLNEDHSNSLDCDGVNATTTVAGTDIGGYPVPPGQDAHYGRDAKAMASTLTKTGGGSAGFDFIKVCNSGELAGEGACPNDPALGSSNNEWACTLDNVTGLMWEVKVNELGHLRHRNSTYTWYNPDNVTNGGSVGTQNGGICALSDCDTHDFVRAVNVQGLCGATDWRLPSHRELLSIVHNGRVGLSIDTDWFPNASFNWLWSSSPSPAAELSARLIEFNRGGVIESLKSLSTQVRLVRAGQ